TRRESRVSKQETRRRVKSPARFRGQTVTVRLAHYIDDATAIGFDKNRLAVHGHIAVLVVRDFLNLYGLRERRANNDFALKIDWLRTMFLNVGHHLLWRSDRVDSTAGNRAGCATNGCTNRS